MNEPANIDYRALIEAAPDAMVVSDHNGVIVMVNAQAEKLFGHSRQDLLGKHIEVLMPRRFQSDHVDRRKQYLAVPHTRPLGTELELYGLRKDGTEFPAEISLSPLRTKDGVLVSSAIRDISERKDFQRTLHEKKLLEEEIAQRRRTEQRLNSFFAGATAGLALVDSNLRFIQINHTLAAMNGLSVEQHIGKVVAEVVPGLARLVVPIFERVLSTGEPALDVEVSGETASEPGIKRHWIESYFPIQGEHGKPEGVGIIVVEITARKLAEEKLRLSDEILKNVGTLVLVGDRNGEIVFASPSIKNILGYTPEEVIGEKWWSQLDSQHSAEVRNYVARAARGELSIRHQWPRPVPVRHKDGSERQLLWFDAKGPGETVIGVADDITHLKQAEDALRDSEERYRLIFDQNPQPMWLVDRASMGFLAVNDATVELYGYSREEFLGMKIEELYPAEDLPALRRSVAEHRHVKRANRGVWRHKKKDGSIVQMEIVRHALELGGRPVGLVLATDVTEKTSLEQQLRQAQKMEAVGQLAAGVAHDFNNILNVILGYSELALGKIGESDPLRAHVSEIAAAGRRAASLTRQLLAFSRQQVLQPRIMNLNEALADMHKLLCRLLREDVEMVIAPSQGAGQIKADPGQIEQVIINLVVNARDAMPSGGRLTIETRNVTLDDSYREIHPHVTTGSYVMLAISDTGVGMDAETKARIFEPFFTTKGIGKGTGLGLATVYGIVKQSGGFIWVYSEPGIGSTFKIYLPRATDEVARGTSESAITATTRGTETVLFVEDEPVLRDLGRQILESHGYAVLSAANGQEALKVAGQQQGPIDLLVTDVVLPGINGRVLAEQLLPQRPRMRVLYVSGYTDDAIASHGVLESGISFLQKPYSVRDLLQMIRKVLDTGRGG